MTVLPTDTLLIKAEASKLPFDILLTPDDNGTYLITSPEVPSLVSYGTDVEDCIIHARNAINEVIASIAAGDNPCADPKIRNDLDPCVPTELEYMFVAIVDKLKETMGGKFPSYYTTLEDLHTTVSNKIVLYKASSYPKKESNDERT